MSRLRTRRGCLAFAAVTFAAVSATAEDRVPSLSAKDRAEIQQLAVEYGRALGTCAAEDYARLFEPDGPDGSYVDDTYVKTKGGWRFKLRQVITGQEKAAQLAGPDFLAIRRLAGDGSPDYGDVYSSTPDGWRFRSSGVVIAATPAAGVTGRVHLKAGGRYDDVYANSPNGWRFQSRTFVPEVASGPQGQPQQVR